MIITYIDYTATLGTTHRLGMISRVWNEATLSIIRENKGIPIMLIKDR